MFSRRAKISTNLADAFIFLTSSFSVRAIIRQLFWLKRNGADTVVLQTEPKPPSSLQYEARCGSLLVALLAVNLEDPIPTVHLCCWVVCFFACIFENVV